MKRIKFRYADALSKWEWRYQQCTCRSVEECIRIYGLDNDCKYEILSIEDLDQK